MAQLTLNEWLYREIRDAIIGGKLMPGTQLNENALAAQYNVSSTPVRETLARLHQEGYVEVRPRKNRCVKQFDRKMIEDLFEARVILETKAVERIAAILEPSECNELRDMVLMEEYNLLSGHVETYQELDRRFHRKLISLLKNDLVDEMSKTFWDKTQWIRNVLPPTKNELRRGLEEHKAIMEALVAGDGQRASCLLEQHLERVVSVILEAYDKFYGEAE